MEQILTYFIITASLMTVKLTVTESTDEIKLKISKRYYHIPMFINICDIEDRRSKIHCYCDNNIPKLATRADCWIFSGGITEDDPIWPNFSSQSEIEHLMFNVRSDEALTFIPAKAVVRLDKLKYISIQFGTIKRIPPYAFTNSSTVRQIFLRSNKITALEKHSFSQMMMLSNLSLDDNQISELKRDVFFNLPNLHMLHLSNNNLSLIYEGCFKHLNNLIELKLDFNYISVMTRETFEGLENLSRLNLRSNKLTMIGNLAFSELWGLKELMLDNNLIEYISERAFGGLSQLRKLSLAGNKLTTFYEDILEDINSLIVLDLRDNLLETISYETIRPVVENDKSASTAVYLEGNSSQYRRTKEVLHYVDSEEFPIASAQSTGNQLSVEVFRREYSMEFFKGNPLSCNCRLSWVYALRNGTQDNILKQALEKISCVAETSADRRLNDQDNAESANFENDNILSDDNYDYYENYNDKNKSKAHKATKLLDIPLEALPCPKELMQSIEESYGHPVQNEIRLKAFSKVGIITPNFVLTAVLAKLLF